MYCYVFDGIATFFAILKICSVLDTQTYYVPLHLVFTPYSQQKHKKINFLEYTDFTSIITNTVQYVQNTP